MGKIEQYKADSIILEQNKVYREIYKIISGKAAVYINYGLSNEYLVGVLPEQRFFGEIGFFTGYPNPFTIVALDDVVLMKVNEEEFETFVVQNPKNTIDIMRNIANNSVTLNKHINLILEELEQSLSNVKDKKDIIDIREKLLLYKCSSAYLDAFNHTI